ncbi:Transducin/WD40 repeat-like superfamily protein, putative [Theobroma cacao]|uniref:Transducin/WD40 repeat-like superfamily protein, putative n=1 Tax=Theobroma cacao TaxID=3641 RepID=A0A061FTI9_THECC|nr:Transducin/WD40 repeat-like superfamily protein, putative [Theobroma cacao]
MSKALSKESSNEAASPIQPLDTASSHDTTNLTGQCLLAEISKHDGAENREELLSSLLSSSDSLAAVESGILLAMHGGTLQPHKAPQPDPRQGSNFTPQLCQRTLEETLDSFQKSIHGDMRNLHIEILRQFHMQEMEMSRVMSSILENQAELMKEVQSLRKENQQIRQLL